MTKGIVKWFNANKGFGFIQPEGGGKDVFVHVTAVREAGLETLDENQEVEFEMVDGTYMSISAASGSADVWRREAMATTSTRSPLADALVAHRAHKVTVQGVGFHQRRVVK